MCFPYVSPYLTSLYEGRNANIEQEVVADLVGDYLFTDTDFVNRLSTEHRNVFEKIFDEIKYLCKVATAGSKEARQLEKVKKAFEEAYRSEDAKNPTTEGGVRYSIVNLDTGKSYVQASRQVIHGDSVSEWRSQISEFFNNALKKGPIEIETIEGDVLTISKRTAEKARAKTATENGISRELTDKEFLVKLHAEAHIDELAEISRKNRRPPVPDGKNHSFAKDGFTYRTVYFQDFDGSYYKVTLSVGENNGVSTVYNVGKIKADDIPDGKIISTIGSKADMSSTKLSISPESGNVNTKNSLPYQQADDLFPLPGNTYGKDITLEFPLPPGYTERANAATAQNKGTTLEFPLPPGYEEQSQVATGKEHISLEDYANQESPVWRNVEYADEATKAAITQETHDRMVSSGAVVNVSEDVMNTVERSFPDLRSMKKKERTPILKEAISKLKNNIRQFLTGLSNQSFEFEVNGKILDAKLYSTGINEVLEKVTQEKANVLYSTEEIFRNAQYLYSTPDYDGDPNVYRWNYFYSPVKIGEETVGVRIAVRDVVKGVGMTPESQIYNWGIKKDASLDGGRRGPRVASSGVSSDASNNSISESAPVVNREAVGAAPSGFDPVSHLQYKYGLLPEGENTVREDSLPKSITGKDRVSLTARTVKGAEATPDEFVDLLDRETVEGELSYLSIKNDATVKAAYEAIVREGWEAAKYKWEADVRAGRVTPSMV